MAPVRFLHLSMFPSWLARGDVVSPDDSRFSDHINDQGLFVSHPDLSVAGLSLLWMLGRYCVGGDDVVIHVPLPDAKA